MVDTIKNQFLKIKNEVNLYISSGPIHSTLDLIKMKTGAKPALIIMSTADSFNTHLIISYIV
jgi:hypothetical protein